MKYLLLVTAFMPLVACGVSPEEQAAIAKQQQIVAMADNACNSGDLEACYVVLDHEQEQLAQAEDRRQRQAAALLAMSASMNDMTTRSQMQNATIRVQTHCNTFGTMTNCY